MLAASGIITEADRDALLGGPRARRARARRRRVPVPARRRGHPHGDRAAPDGDRRARRRPAAHRALAQRPGRDRHGDVHARPRAAGRSSASSTSRACSCSSPTRTWTGRCPATRTCSARSPCTSRTTCWRTSGCSGATRARFEFVLGSTDELPLGAGALAGVNFATDRRLLASELGFAGVVAELDRRGLQPRLRARLPVGRGHLRDPPVAPGRGDRALVERGVRLLRGLGRLGVGLLDHAAEEEPGRGRAAARQGAARRRPPGRAPRRDARPPADLQQGHAGGQGAPVRRRRHARAVPAGRARDARDDHVRPRARSPPPPPTR